MPKVTDAKGALQKLLEEVKLFRGLRGDQLDTLDPTKGRPGYSVFASSDPHVASSYGNPDLSLKESGAVFPFRARPKKIIEFPVQKSKWSSGNEFDKFEFDRVASQLKPGEALVARNVYDAGPRASRETDPEGKFSYPSDVWAIGPEVETTPLHKAKGGKASALDAALQYVKNKLPQTGFFSTLDELIGSAPFEKAPIGQWKNYLKPGRTFERNGVRFPLKQEELDYTFGHPHAQDPEGGVYLAPNSVMSKDELRQWIRDRRPDLRLRVGLPETYPGVGAERFPPEEELGDPANSYDRFRDAPTVREAMYANYAHGQNPSPGEPAAPYEESWIRSTDFGPTEVGHFGPDVISHSRTTVQPTPDPDDTTGRLGGPRASDKLMRLIEEIQSDRHQRAAERWAPNRDPSMQDQDLFPGRRGYRTPAAEMDLDQRIRDLTDQIKRFQSHVDVGQYPDNNLGLSPENDAKITELARQKDDLLRQKQELSRKPGDAPFKDPADYATLELKNQMLNAAKQGQDYLGLIKGKDVSDRFSHNPEQAAGTAYTYDKVYRSALDKLARQYGIEVRDVPTTLKSSIDVATPTMRQHGIETVGDLLSDFERYADVSDPDDVELHLDRLGDVISEARIPYSNAADRAEVSLAQLRRELSGLSEDELMNSFDSNADVRSWWNQLRDDLGQAHAEYADRIRAQKGPQASTKSFPAMVLTPEVRDKILKTGVPIWALSGATAAGALMNRDPGTQDYADGGIARLKSMAENVGTKDTIDRRKRILSGLASQWFGINPDTGKVEFLGGLNPGIPNLRSMDEIRNRYKQYAETGEVPQDGGPGILDEVQSMFLGSDRAKEADARLAALKSQIKGQMGIGDPHGFGENFDEALGTMLGQLPVPASATKTKMIEKIPFVQKLKSAAKEIPASVVEWFSPTIQPSIKNYLAGSTVGGGIGALADMGDDETPPVKKAEGGEVTKPLHEMLGLLKSRLNELNGVPNAQQIAGPTPFDGSGET